MDMVRLEISSILFYTYESMVLVLYILYLRENVDKVFSVSLLFGRDAYLLLQTHFKVIGFGRLFLFVSLPSR